MAELNLRVPGELHERIEIVCARHELNITDFLTRAVRQFYSGRLKPVVQHELLECTTYGGKRIQVRNWPFDLRGKKLTALLISALIKLEKVKTKKMPVITEIEGIDYVLE